MYMHYNVSSVCTEETETDKYSTFPLSLLFNDIGNRNSDCNL